MNKTTIPESQTTSPHSPKEMMKPINFYCQNRTAKSVSVIGEFNHWNPMVHPMQRREDGWWFVSIPMSHGHHQYLFLVDGVPTLDPHSAGTVYIKPSTKASVIAVS